MKKGLLLCLVLIWTMLLLQGCAFMEPEISKTVEISSSGKSVNAILKSDSEQNYKWICFSEKGNLDEVRSKFKKSMFSNTYIQDYKFNMDDVGTDTLYLVYYLPDDLENGKVYTYKVTLSEKNVLSIEEEKESSLFYHEDLLKRVQEMQ
ncbi:MAG: hypothetical protein IJ429_02810 [Lachnospiraceae bacterium]|nr:hypothetical protein [Lachnospiraceae bacterium]